LWRIRLDTLVGMAISNLIAIAILITTAATLHSKGITDIQTSAQAAQALKPVAGAFAEVVFALGIIGTGLLAVPVLAGSTAYAIGEGRKWPVGLARKPKEATAFYTVLSISVASAVALNFMPIDPIKALYWSAVINGVLAAPVMAALMVLVRKKEVMGDLVVRGADALVERHVGRFEASVAPVPPAGASQAGGGVDVEEERQVGVDAVAGERVDEAHSRRLDPAAGLLVRLRRVGEPVADDERPGSEGRTNRLGDVLPPVGLVEQPLRDRIEVRVLDVHQDLPDPAADPRSAWLAGLADRMAQGSQPLGHEADLSGLAASLDPFERHERHGAER